jgi:hypothetical protein
MVTLFSFSSMMIGKKSFVQWMKKCLQIITNIIRLILLLVWYGLAVVFDYVYGDMCLHSYAN